MGDTAPTALEARIQQAHARGEFDEATRVALEGYGPELLRFVLTLVRDPASADDVFAEACIDMWRGLPKLAFRSSFRTWAFTVTRRTCYRHLRSPTLRRQPLHTTGALEQVVESVRSRTRPHLQTAVKDRVARLRESLSTEEQELLSLRVDRRLEWPEITEILAEKPLEPSEARRQAATLRKRYERLTDKLRELAREAGLLDEA